MKMSWKWYWGSEKKRDTLIPRARSNSHTRTRESFETLSCSDCGKILGYASISGITLPVQPVYQNIEIECLCKECYQKKLAQTKKARKARRSKKEKISSRDLILIWYSFTCQTHACIENANNNKHPLFFLNNHFICQIVFILKRWKQWNRRYMKEKWYH